MLFKNTYISKIAKIKRGNEFQHNSTDETWLERVNIFSSYFLCLIEYLDSSHCTYLLQGAISCSNCSKQMLRTSVKDLFNTIM